MKKITLLLFSVLATLNFVSAEVSYQNVYVVGNGCDAGWDPGKAIEMTQESDGVFTWTGNLYAPTNDQQRFKFLVARDWNPSFTCRWNVPGHLVITSGEEYDLYEYNGGDYDNAFQVPETGVYAIVVNFNTMKMTCTIQGDVTIPTPDMYSLYISGSALSPDGNWDYDNPTEMTITAAGVFTWTGNLYNNPAGNQFKFKNVSDSWDKTICATADNTPISAGKFDLNFRPLESSPNDYKFIVTTPGEYTIDVDLNTMKMTCTPVSLGQVLYIVGSACISGWDPGSAPQMIQIGGDNIFTWTGTLLSNQEFKFLQDRAWENSITVGDPESENVTITSGVSESLRVNTDGNDNKFQVPVSGIYTVTVNLNDMVMVCAEENVPTTFNQLFIVGDATTVGWDDQNALEMQMDGDGIFSWTGELFGKTDDNAGRGFKFLTDRTWDNSITVGNPSSEYVTINSGVEEILRVFDGGNDNRFQVSEDNTYVVVVNLNTMIMTVTEKSEMGIIDVQKPSNEIFVLDKTVRIGSDATDIIQTAGIYDITGRCLNFISNAKGSTVLADNLTNGVYIVKMNIHNEKYVQKIIIR